MVTVNDLINRWRTLSQDEQDKATIYIGDCESALHVIATGQGVDLDERLTDTNYATLYTAIVCDVVRREMTSTGDGPAVTQYSQSVNGYNMQGTFLSAGGGLFIKNSELKLLGLRKQIARAVELYGN